MKKGLFMALAAIAMMIGSSALAQKPMPKSPEEVVKMKADKIKVDLKLTDQQAKQVYDQLMWNSQQKQENAQQTWKKTDMKMKEVLTPDQYVKWTEMQKQKMEKMKSHEPMKEGHDKKM